MPAKWHIGGALRVFHVANCDMLVGLRVVINKNAVLLVDTRCKLDVARARCTSQRRVYGPSQRLVVCVASGALLVCYYWSTTYVQYIYCACLVGSEHPWPARLSRSCTLNPPPLPPAMWRACSDEWYVTRRELRNSAMLQWPGPSGMPNGVVGHAALQ